MKENWILIYKTTEPFQARLAEDVLKQNGIVSHIIGKTDSAIPAIGAAELFVLPDDAEEAKIILTENGFN